MKYCLDADKVFRDNDVSCIDTGDAIKMLDRRVVVINAELDHVFILTPVSGIRKNLAFSLTKDLFKRYYIIESQSIFDSFSVWWMGERLKQAVTLKRNIGELCIRE